MKVLIIQARFNHTITNRLLMGAEGVLTANGAEWSVREVPGVWEIPAAVASALNEDVPPEGIVVLGAVIQGETDHHIHLASSVFGALAQVQVAENVPVGLGILTVENQEQAKERVGGKKGNKGAEAALAVVEMVGG
ncbi:6,7-dimethyl-8-ribityllumazine synthase [bacterium]|nr:6,7-dimethyl-8-ribityllumazine synthase [bacterium]